MPVDRLNPQERLAKLLHSPAGTFAFLLLKLLGIELPRSVHFGPGLRLPHGASGLVVHERTVIGSNVRLYQGVTLGRGDQYLPRDEVSNTGRIVIEDNVIVSTGAVILFRSDEEIRIGRGAIVGANAVVTKSVPAGEVWAGVPARRISVSRSKRA